MLNIERATLGELYLMPVRQKSARDEYGAGIGEYTMLLSTQRSLLSARESELNNRADRANSYITLYRALGGDWAVNQSVSKSAAPTAAGK